MEREKVISWIQKLATKAMDPACSPGEANSLQEKVAQLMAKYKISEMEATTPEEIEDHEMMREEIKFAQTGRMTWGYYLAWGIAPVFECEAVRKHNSQVMMFFGFPDDVKTVAFFFRFFQIQIIDFADKSGFSTVKDKNSYALGMTKKLVTRIALAYKRAKEIVPSQCRDLIVVKEGAVKRYRENEIGRTINSRMNTNLNGDAYTKGYVDGDKVNIVNPNLDHLAN
jgi:hypothetical protein